MAATEGHADLMNWQNVLAQLVNSFRALERCTSIHANMEGIAQRLASSAHFNSPPLPLLCSTPLFRTQSGQLAAAPGTLAAAC